MILVQCCSQMKLPQPNYMFNRQGDVSIYRYSYNRKYANIQFMSNIHCTDEVEEEVEEEKL